MLGNIDYIMNYNDGLFHHSCINPHILGKGGLGYKPYRIQGGMAFQNIETGKLDHELYEKYGVNNIPDLVGEVMKSNIPGKEKMNFLLKEAVDLWTDLDDKARATDNDELLAEVRQSQRVIKDAFQQLKDEGVKKTPEQRELYNTLARDIKSINVDEERVIDTYNNPHYDMNDTGSATDRGNKVEKDLEDNQTILDIVDKDYSKARDTKDIEAYNPEFINALYKMISGRPDLPNFDPSLIPPSSINRMIDKFLQYVPVDMVKDNTIWEIKSFNKGLSGNQNIKQEMSETKMKGYQNKFFEDLSKTLGEGYYMYSRPFNYEMVFKDVNGERKLDNIYFTFKSPVEHFGSKTNYSYNFDKIPLFKPNPKGYNYYWIYDNIDKIGYINPLKNENFEEYKSQLNNPNQKVNDKGKKIIEVKNKDIRIMPYSYPKILSGFKQNNEKMDTVNKLEQKVLKKPLKVIKKII